MSDLRNINLDSLVDPTGYVDHQGIRTEAPPEIATDGDWDMWSIGYLLVEIHRLNTAMKSRVPKSQDRQSIIVEYFHGFVDLLEMGAIKRPDAAELPVVFPQLVFAEKPYNPEDGAGESTRVHLAPSCTPLEEYVGGLIANYFAEMGEQLDAELVLHTE